jgi:2-polyprenyl-3-methyl-5-hydroxy-6-metoxy-1,4-benzoquinol methylase
MNVNPNIKIDFSALEGTNSDYYTEFFTYINKLVAAGLIDVESSIESFTKLCYEFMILQSRFLRNRTYNSSSFEEVNQKVYQNSIYMETDYLNGLLFTYALWLNHKKIYDYFLNFIDRLEKKRLRSCLEIGVGHGLMTYSLINKFPQMRYSGIDISMSSIKIAGERMRAIYPETKLNFQIMDATAEMNYAAGYKFDLILCCEVLEHVENPNLVLNNIYEKLGDSGVSFVTTVINLEAIDHIYLFHDVDNLESFFENNNLEVLDRLVLPIPNSQQVPDLLQANYVAVLRKSHKKK